MVGEVYGYKKRKSHRDKRYHLLIAKVLQKKYDRVLIAYCDHTGHKIERWVPIDSLKTVEGGGT